MPNVQRTTNVETLYASSPTIEGITKAIARFYCGSTITLVPTGGQWGDHWEVHTGKGKCSTIVRLVKGRYRFVSPA
jgi:hypothetical protein